MWRGSIHSSRRLTTSPLPPPSTPPESRMTGNSARSIDAHLRVEERRAELGHLPVVLALVDAVAQLGGLEHGPR